MRELRKRYITQQRNTVNIAYKEKSYGRLEKIL